MKGQCAKRVSITIQAISLSLFLGTSIVPINYILLPQLTGNFTNIIMEKQDLHVFILDDQELSLQKLIDIYGSRNRLNEEYWLFDVSSVKNPNEKFQNLSLGKLLVQIFTT